MTLQERLTEDFKAAMKAHDEVKKNTLSFARAAIKQVEVDTRKEVEDADVLAILKKQVKMILKRRGGPICWIPTKRRSRSWRRICRNR